MDKQILKRTLNRTLKWYPLVILVMFILGTVLIRGDLEMRYVILICAGGAIIGPALEAMFYYQEQKKKADEMAAMPTRSPAERLNEAAQLHKNGLINAEEFERIRANALQELETGCNPAPAKPAAIPSASPSTSALAQTRGHVKQPFLAILLALSWPAMGFFPCFLLEAILDIDIPKLFVAIVSLVVVGGTAFSLFPRVYGVPFGIVSVREFTRRLGFYLPTGAWRHILLGVVLAACTLGGMLAASLITGRYQLDWSNINLPQLVFSLNPGLWEEMFYRGVMMMVLLPLTKSIKKAGIAQIVIFGLAHIKGIDLLTFIDVFSVMILAIGFTYAAYKTRSLVAGIVFHYLHDAFLFFVQVPDGTYQGVQENIIFYACLWLMVGIGCLVTRFAADRLHVRADAELYNQPAGFQIS